MCALFKYYTHEFNRFSTCNPILNRQTNKLNKYLTIQKKYNNNKKANKVKTWKKSYIHYI